MDNFIKRDSEKQGYPEISNNDYDNEFGNEMGNDYSNNAENQMPVNDISEIPNQQRLDVSTSQFSRLDNKIMNTSMPPSYLADVKYDNVRVSFPVSQDGKIGNYMVYVVRYSYRGSEFKINRRFSDFISLRNALRKYLPCHYIIPAHRKRPVVS